MKPDILPSWPVCVDQSMVFGVIPPIKPLPKCNGIKSPTNEIYHNGTHPVTQFVDIK